MPYKITSVTTKPSLSTPNFDEWLLTVPESVLAAFPDAAGKTPTQVIEDSVAILSDPAEGFISQGGVPDNDDLSWTWEAVWASKEHWANSVAKSHFIAAETPSDCSPKQEDIEKASSFLRKLYRTENNITVENFEANI